MGVEFDYEGASAALQQDVEDMFDILDTMVERCRNCDRIYPIGFLCPNCGHDNSIEEGD
jgi:rRNA maturation endonuclease Nob1|tara:strand:+ start:739 stop:915 length:177 start_codon:yes stop_codon:yes gene_type:complete